METYKDFSVQTAEEILDMDFDELDSIMNEITEFNKKMIKRMDDYDKEHKKSDGFEAFNSYKEIYRLKNDLKNTNSRVEIIQRLESWNETRKRKL